MPDPNPAKRSWEATVLGVQPRIRLLRSFDELSHVYQGYTLWLKGTMDGVPQEFLVGVGKAAQARQQFRVGDRVSGKSEAVADPRREGAEYYKTSQLRLLARGETEPEAPPWAGVPPALETYRARGHRRLAARTYAGDCRRCLWGCRMAVEMTIDHWNPGPKRYRFETFCYGPKSCDRYHAGPTRKVPGRKGMSYEEEDWVDEDATGHRGVDE